MCGVVELFNILKLKLVIKETDLSPHYFIYDDEEYYVHDF